VTKKRAHLFSATGMPPTLMQSRPVKSENGISPFAKIKILNVHTGAAEGIDITKS